MADPQEQLSATPSSTSRGDGPFTLNIAGVVVTRAQLVAALQPFLPQLTDIQSFGDGERFFFVLRNEAPVTIEEVS